jgi:hypothetical protein
MSNNSFTEIENNSLTVFNIPEYARSHPIFNAGYIDNIPVARDLADTGLPGDILIYSGSEFFLGSTFTGATGFTGPTGPQGSPGTASNTGATGPTGYTGYTGPQGLPGFSTETGATGPTGATGYTGYTGSIGPTGPAGGFGGASFDYTFNTSTTIADPGTGELSLNSSDVSTANVLSINETDADGANIEKFLRTIQDNTSDIKGFFKITEVDNRDNFAFYEINSMTENGSWWSINSTFLDSSISGMTFFGDISITFARTGDQGIQGNTGPTGYTGFTGYTGYTGFTGYTGYTGVTGFTGYTGYTGFTGYTGYTGVTGFTGYTGYTGFTGYTG